MGGFHPWVLLSIASKRSLKLLGLWYVYPRMRGCCLGVLDSKKHNERLLMKHLHKFYNRLEIHWVKLIWQKFYSSGQLPVSIQRASFWWRDILKLLSSFKGLASIQLADGSTCYLWANNWAREALSAKYLELFSYVKNRNLSVFHAYRLPST